MRKPAVAGQFYPDRVKDLDNAIIEAFTHPLGPGEVPSLSPDRKGKILGGVVPHAGYIYSGPVAANFYHELALDGFPDSFIIIGPNHTGLGSMVSMALEDFQTPYGIAKIDRDLARLIHKGIVDVDIQAHIYEHSVEVQLPFLQFFKREIKFVPIVMMAQDYEFALELSGIIHDAINERDVVVIASSDFSHYVPKKSAYERDLKAINFLLSGDVKSFYRAIEEYNVTACGYGPIATAMMATRGRAKLLKYATSGDVFPMEEVVGYASISIER